jgi:hypothetical protein
MFRFSLAQGLAFQFLLTLCTLVSGESSPNCRSQPGDPSFPTSNQLASFNRSIDGRLINVVPSAEFCMRLPGGCPDAEWFSGNFRDNIPGALLQVSVLLLFKTLVAHGSRLKYAGELGTGIVVNHHHLSKTTLIPEYQR